MAKNNKEEGGVFEAGEAVRLKRIFETALVLFGQDPISSADLRKLTFALIDVLSKKGANDTDAGIAIATVERMERSEPRVPYTK